MNINFDSDMYKKLQAKATEQHTTIPALIKELVDLPPGLDTTVS